MLFNEIYGDYYRAVSSVLEAAVKCRLDRRTMTRIVSETAFSDSVLDLVPSLTDGIWQLVLPDYSTPLKTVPALPLTLLEKRWLKTISLDKRFSLFDIPDDLIPDVEPLFDPADVIYYDRYTDGDPYTDEVYIRHFRLVLDGLRRGSALRIRHLNRHGKEQERVCVPLYLEYADRDDKFRLHAMQDGMEYTINLSRILDVEAVDIGSVAACGEQEESEALSRADDREDGGGIFFAGDNKRQQETMLMELTDERNVLERALTQLSHYQKRAWEKEDGVYLLELIYDVADETDLLIQVMSFGPYVRLLSPESMVCALRERISRQRDLFEESTHSR